MIKKDSYHIRNWKQYNQSLVNRGSITFWFNDEAIAKWYSNERREKPGRPDVYSDDTIRCALIIKVVFHVALRQLQGLTTSLIKILGFDVVCPHYSVFSRRAKNLDIPMRKFLKRGEHLNIIQRASRSLGMASGKCVNMVIPSEEPGEKFMLAFVRTRARLLSALLRRTM